VNETLSRIIGSLLAQRIGESIATGSDAYRIVLTVPRSVRPALVRDILESIRPETIEGLVRLILRKSSFLQWEALKVARKFCIVSKEAEYDRYTLDRVLDIYENTPFMQEVIERTMWDRMHLDETRWAVERIRSRDIDILVQPLAPITLEGEKARQEFLRPFGVDVATLRALEKRLGETPVTLSCVNCGHVVDSRVYRAPLACPRCTSKMLAAAVGTRESGRRTDIKSASLVAAHGRRALLVLAGYGIGPDTAARILAKQKEDLDLLKEILKAEVTYARTRRFWGD
jgi:ATP-dependent Lhr-like helicase